MQTTEVADSQMLLRLLDPFDEGVAEAIASMDSNGRNQGRMRFLVTDQATQKWPRDLNSLSVSGTRSYKAWRLTRETNGICLNCQGS